MCAPHDRLPVPFWCLVFALLLCPPATGHAAPPVASADSSPGKEEAAVQLRFVFGAENEVERAALLDGVARFEAAHPGIDVEPVPFQWLGYGFHDTLVRLLALEDPSVDVYRIDVPWIPELAAPGWLLPLEPWVDADDRARFVPVTIEGGSHRGQLYALPLSLKGNLLFYRRDLLETHGLEPPKTLAELKSQAALLREAEGLSAGLALHPAYFYNDVLPMIWASGGGVLDDKGAVTLDSRVNASVLREVAAMFDEGPKAAVPFELFKGRWAESYSALDGDFLAGDAAFAITWSTRWHQQKGTPVEGRIGVMPIPGLEEGNGSSNLGSYYLGVNAFGAHPEESVAFVRFMTGPEAQAARLELIGELPALPELHEDEERMASHPELAVMSPALAVGGIRPRVADERALGVILEEAFHNVIDGEQPAETALSLAAERIRTEIGAVPPNVLPHGLTTPQGRSSGSWTRPMMVGGGLIVFFLSGVALLLLARRRLYWEVLVTLQGKLLLGGAVAVVLLAASSTTVATSLAFRAQQREIEQHRSFFAERVREQAESLGKSTGLALSLLDEQVSGQPLEDQEAVLAQLLMVSQFTDDLIFVELLNNDGSLRLSDRHSLFLSGGAPAPRPPPPEGLPELVASRAIHTYQHQDGGAPWVEVVVPLFREGVHHGALRLGLSRHRFDTSLGQTEARHAATLRDLTWAIALTGLGLLLLCLLGVAVFARRLARPVEELTAAAARVRSGDLDFKIQPSSRDEVGALAEAMGEMVQGLRDRDFIRDAFGRYLTPELADKLVADPNALMLGGHERTVTILMSDLRGFSGLSDRLGPEAMVALLNRYLAAMTEVILRHRGMINEFIGDAILVLFGALEAQEDDVDRALRCALDMQRALREFNRENESRNLPVLAMGIGLNTGAVVAGNIGSEQRVKYGVVGPPVNHAARLESLTVGSQVFVSADSLQSCQSLAHTRGPLEVQVKGNEQPLSYYELLGIEGEPELDLVEAFRARVPLSVPARFARLEGKRVPEKRILCSTTALSPDSVLLDLNTELTTHDSVVLELDLPEHGWTQALWGKIVHSEPGAVELALTSIGPEDLAALEALAQD